MELVICKDATHLAKQVSLWCQRRVHLRRQTSVYIPAGQTPVPLYQLWEKEKPEFLDSLRLVQIDDVLSGPRRGIFRQFLSDHLPSRARQFNWIENDASGATGGNEQAELAILGLGLNGHVAFHEPYLPAQFFSGCVRLSKATTTALQLEPETWGVTYGVGAFMSTQGIALMVSGSFKHEILTKLIEKRGEFPAQHLHRHLDFTIFADRAAQEGSD